MLLLPSTTTRLSRGEDVAWRDGDGKQEIRYVKEAAGSTACLLSA